MTQDIRGAARSSNPILSSSFQSVQSGIQKVASTQGGIAAVKDSFAVATASKAEVNIPPSQRGVIENPSAYTERATSSGLKISAFSSNQELQKNFNDPKLDLMDKASQLNQSVFEHIKKMSDKREDLNNSAKELQERLKDLQEELKEGSDNDPFDLFRSFFGDDSGESALSQFQIQELMSDYNQAESLASSVQKKKDDVSNEILKNV
jgi:hypothetical protein